MVDLMNISPGKKVPDVFNAIVEIPKGSGVKYEFDREHGIVKADRVMHSTFKYPFNYGFVPRTLWVDKDAIDVMILGEQIYPNVLVEVRPVGSLFMNDSGWKDDKILAVPTRDPKYNEIKDTKDLPAHLLKEILHFFKHYKDLEGKQIAGLKWSNVYDAKKIILKGMENYKSKK